MLSQSLCASLLGFQLSCLTEKADDTSENWRRWSDTRLAGTRDTDEVNILLCASMNTQLSFWIWEFCASPRITGGLPRLPEARVPILLLWVGRGHLGSAVAPSFPWQQPQPLAPDTQPGIPWDRSGTRKHKSQSMGPESSDLLIQSVISEPSGWVLLGGVSWLLCPLKWYLLCVFHNKTYRMLDGSQTAIHLPEAGYSVVLH